MTTDPFAGPFTLREQWSMFKARMHLRLRHRGPRGLWRCDQ